MEKYFNILFLFIISWVLFSCGAGTDSNASVSMNVTALQCTGIGSSGNLCTLNLQYSSSSTVTLSVTAPDSSFIINLQSNSCTIGNQQINGNGQCSIYVSCSGACTSGMSGIVGINFNGSIYNQTVTY